MVDSTLQLAPFYLAFDSGEERLFSLNYTNSDGELASTRFTYNNRGRNQYAFFQQITGSRSSRNEHHFNKAGQLTRRLQAFNDGLASEELFEFDRSGRLIRESYTDSTGLEGETRFLYDESGRAASLRARLYKGWFTGDIHFTFDASGKRLSGRIETPGGPGGTIEYGYKGPTLVNEFWTIGDWNQTFQFVYESASASDS
ncbi:MAG: hypothetical protein R6V45_11820 [Oceanipulchritudo sp.]